MRATSSGFLTARKLETCTIRGLLPPPSRLLEVDAAWKVVQVDEVRDDDRRTVQVETSLRATSAYAFDTVVSTSVSRSAASHSLVRRVHHVRPVQRPDERGALARAAPSGAGRRVRTARRSGSGPPRCRPDGRRFDVSLERRESKRVPQWLDRRSSSRSAAGLRTARAGPRTAPLVGRAAGPPRAAKRSVRDARAAR